MILLIQFRTDQSGWHEVRCVYEGCKQPYNNFLIVNVANPSMTTDYLLNVAKKCDYIMIGGSGTIGYECENEPQSEAYQEFTKIRSLIIPFLQEIARQDNKPTLGFCLGHQLLADALGGKVQVDPKQAETGVIKIGLNDAGKKSSLFTGVKKDFFAIEGHKTSVVQLPKKAVLLASSEKCPIQAFRYKKNIYATQFHSELNYQDLLFRLTLYPEYKENMDTNDQLNTDKQLKSKRVLQNFISLMKVKGYHIR